MEATVENRFEAGSDGSSVTFNERGESSGSVGVADVR